MTYALVVAAFCVIAFVVGYRMGIAEGVWEGEYRAAKRQSIHYEGVSNATMRQIHEALDREFRTRPPACAVERPTPDPEES